MGKTNKCDSSCWNVESLVSVDDRGQMVLPKDLREKANIKPGDKLALVTWENNGKICCISLIKADEISGMLKRSLEPMVSDIVGASKH